MDIRPRLLPLVSLIILLVSTCHITSLHAANAAVRLCQSPEYDCIKAKRGDSWTKLWPDLEQRRKVMQVNRTNGSLYRGKTVAVPKNLEQKDYLDLAPFRRQITAPGEKVIIFDPSKHAWAAYNPEGDLVRWGAASGGANWCADIQSSCRTPSGSFRIYHKGGEDCISTKYPLPDGGAHMPYCMFFNGGYALHGSPGAVPGYNASHGCTRLFVHDAQWLNEKFANIGTKVIVRPYNSAEPIKTVRKKQVETIVTERVPAPIVAPRHLQLEDVSAHTGETSIEEVPPQ